MRREPPARKGMPTVPHTNEALKLQPDLANSAQRALEQLVGSARAAGSGETIAAIVRMLPDVIFLCEKDAAGEIRWLLNEGRLAEHILTIYGTGYKLLP